jgi:hypothetical protein
VSPCELTDALAVHNETVRRTLYRMVDSGDLRPSGDGRYTLPEAAPAPEVSAQLEAHQDSKWDTPDTAPDTPDTAPDTPDNEGVAAAFEGIGKYDHATRSMIPWRPKAG